MNPWKALSAIAGVIQSLTLKTAQNEIQEGFEGMNKAKPNMTY